MTIRKIMRQPILVISLESLNYIFDEKLGKMTISVFDSNEIKSTTSFKTTKS